MYFKFIFTLCIIEKKKLFTLKMMPNNIMLGEHYLVIIILRVWSLATSQLPSANNVTKNTG